MSKIMSTHERLLAEALQLPVGERVLLWEKIWESLPEELRAGDFTDEEKVELDRRIADFEANPGDERTWDEVKAELLGRK